MNANTKKTSAGFFLSAATIIITLTALFVYISNGKNAYYKDFDSKIVILTVTAIVVEVLLIAAVRMMGEKRWLDIIYLVAPILLVICAVMFVSTRIESAGLILGSELEKGNVAAHNALYQAFLGIGLYFFALITSLIKSFHGQLKE